MRENYVHAIDAEGIALSLHAGRLGQAVGNIRRTIVLAFALAFFKRIKIIE